MDAQTNFYALNSAIERLERLRNLPSDILQANGFEQTLNDLDGCATALKTLNQYHLHLLGLSDGLRMFTDLLKLDDSRTINGLHCLLKPVQEDLARTLGNISEMI